MLKKCLLGIALLGFSGLYGADETAVRFDLDLSPTPGNSNPPLTVKNAEDLKQYFGSMSNLSMKHCGLTDEIFHIIITDLVFPWNGWTLNVSENNLTDCSVPAITTFIVRQAEKYGLDGCTLNIKTNNISFGGKLEVLKTIKGITGDYSSIELLL